MSSEHPHLVRVVTEFYAEIPTDPDEADQRADAIGDAIAEAMNAIPLICEGSARIIDWESRENLS